MPEITDPTDPGVLAVYAGVTVLGGMAGAFLAAGVMAAAKTLWRRARWAWTRWRWARQSAVTREMAL